MLIYCKYKILLITNAIIVDLFQKKRHALTCPYNIMYLNSGRKCILDFPLEGISLFKITCFPAFPKPFPSLR